MQLLLRLLLWGIANLFLVLLLATTLITWLPKWRWTSWGRLVYTLSEPLLAPVRRLVRPIIIGRAISLDLSSFLVLVIVFIIYKLLDMLILKMGT